MNYWYMSGIHTLFIIKILLLLLLYKTTTITDMYIPLHPAVTGL